MRRRLSVLLAAALLAGAAAPPSSRSAPAPRPALGLPPHAWLFGTWTGGMFPPPETMTVEQCLAQPVLIFTRDVVMRALLTDQLYDQRVIETARASGVGVDFRFSAPPSPPAASSVLGLAAPPVPVGFSCEGPDVLHVQRRTENVIMLPGCADFPYPLVRCR